MDLKKSLWNGFERYDFYFNNRECIVVVPKTCKKSRPWVWRAEFFGAFPSVDIALLKEGWHVAYYQASDLYGCPEAIALMKNFYTYIVEKYKLNPKADIFGFSRGGLYATNYALKFPEDVCTLYIDAPVLDIRSWPGGCGVGIGGKNEWKECMDVYGLTEDTAEFFRENPIDHLDELIKTNIPVVLVAGDSDDVVPYNENGKILADEYLSRNADIKVILKKGIAHHPHSLENPSEIVEYILKSHGEKTALVSQ